MKLLIWLVVVWAAVVWIQRAKKNLARRARDAATARTGATAPNEQTEQTPAIELMVQCAQCGIHFPKSEAILARGTGLVFCCVEHRELHALDAGVR
jgi:uncharacterized protein